MTYMAHSRGFESRLGIQLNNTTKIFMTEIYSNKNLTPEQIEIRDSCLSDFYTYLKVILPDLQLGHCHQDFATHLQGPGNHKLVIFPRAHLKSTIEAAWGCFLITQKPTTTILIASATSGLAEQQVYAMQNILESPMHRRLFPELLGNVKEGQRDKWTQKAFNIEHPIRKKNRIRDNTVYACGAGKTITGLHFDYLFLDDIIADDSDKMNPQTLQGRDAAVRWVSRATSILNPGGGVLAVGTRYHKDDIYAKLKELTLPIFDGDDNIVGNTQLYSVVEKVVEVGGDFLWPKKKAMNGEYYGFDFKTLEVVKASYKHDMSQFYSQYYNDPSDPENKLIDPACFQYYDKENLVSSGTTWYLNNKRLHIFAGMDIAASMEKRADNTVIVVVGVDDSGYKYILDIQRKKTNQISVMSDMLFTAFHKWRFKKFRIETNASQGLAANQMQADMRKRNAVFVWEMKPSRGDKHLRIMSILEPEYTNKNIFHYRGGNTEILEDELVSAKGHDDTKDALAMTCEIVPLVVRRMRTKRKSNVIIHPRFGGVASA